MRERSALRSTQWTYLGRVPYAEATRLQESARDAVRTGEGSEQFLLLEHPPVFTLGRSAADTDIVATQEWLQSHGVEVHATDRGGQVTFHGPGQLVGYPIIDLNPDRRDLRRYIRDLQSVLIRTLTEFGVEARGRSEQAFIGVWSGGQKVASIGVHVSRWITTHGFALNVSTDLSYFAGIVACGLPDVRMASIESLTGRRPALEDVATVCARNFGDVFEREMVASAAAAAR